MKFISRSINSRVFPWFISGSLALTSLTALALPAGTLAQATEPEFVPGEVVVKYESGQQPAALDSSEPQIVKTNNIPLALKRLRRLPGVAYAVPNMVARASGFVPDDPELSARQWNLIGEYGVDAPRAWTELIKLGHPGGRGVKVAVLDTGVAYLNRKPYKRSPDFEARQFAPGYDYIQDDSYPSDLNGHGTHVAGTIAEATDNQIGAAGIAYGAKLIPIRVLDSYGEGNASDVARGIRRAVRGGADIINLSLEFDSSVQAADIPQVIEALRYARQHRVLVVAAAGNEGKGQVSYPARSRLTLSVGASTETGCRAEFSNHSRELDLVAPGGGLDAHIPGDHRCSPRSLGRSIYQMTLIEKNPNRFGLPDGYEGTSMAAPHVAGVAALVLASGVLGPRPSASELETRLKSTARDLGASGDDTQYGAGLIDAGRAVGAPR